MRGVIFIMFSKRIIRSSPKFKIIKNMQYPACYRCFNFANFTPKELLILNILMEYV